MRSIKSLDDAQLAINELLDWRDKLNTKSLDMHGRRITNAGTSVDPDDYVTKKEIPEIKGQTIIAPREYAIIFSKAGAVAAGQVIPPYNIAQERTGFPIDVWARILREDLGGIAPIVDDLEINIYLNGTLILTENLVIPIGEFGPVHSSLFISPFPKFGLDAEVVASIQAGDATALSIGVVVKRA